MPNENIDPIIKELIAKKKNNYILPITALKINNTLKDLQTEVKDYNCLELVDMSCTEGIIIYRRTALFILMSALSELDIDADIIVEHSMNNGIYCRFVPTSAGTVKNINKLRKKMQAFIDMDLPISKRSLCKKDAVKLFTDRKQLAKAALIDNLQQDMVSIYCCKNYCDYLYAPMLPHTGEVRLFAIDHYPPGIVMRTPTLKNPHQLPPKKKQEKLSTLLAEADRWAGILHCDYVNDLNNYNKQQRIGELICISEALQEKKIASIADEIANADDCRVIFIAGPSSSGKTTFAQRLRIQLLVNGLHPVSISMDDYFLDREYSPLNEKGEYDFEAFAALDIDLLDKQILQLVQGKEVIIPKYNFITGKKEWSGKKRSLQPGQPIIIEGIHGLNPNLTNPLPQDKIYKIYISALTQLGIDGHNNISTTGARLIRRIVRDYQFRGSSALKTIKQWPGVRRGEEKNIFPYQENADIMFNSALIYELAVLKKYAYPLLKKISNNVPEYSLSRQLMDFLSFFMDIENEDDIPNNSILREFIGKSCFF